MTKSILENRPALKAEIDKVAEVAGYLWQKGWAERNGGNITINVTEFVDDEIRQLPAISESYPIGCTLPALKGCYFYCKGTNRRMRDLARNPMDNGSIIRILDDCASYVIVADKAVKPTSEIAAHPSSPLPTHRRISDAAAAPVALLRYLKTWETSPPWHSTCHWPYLTPAALCL